jgi:hypothetical protein
VSAGRASRFIPRALWTADQLDADRQQAREQFARERMLEPLEEYLGQFDKVLDVLDDLIESTVDLTQLEDQALDILTDPAKLEGFRYLAGPPVSEDDLKTLADARSIAPQVLRSNPELVTRIVATIRDGIDRRRFPWVTEGRMPTEAEREAAVLASAALIATRRTETNRRSEGKRVQEEQVRQALLDHGFAEVRIPHNVIDTLAEAPQPGQFCREVTLGTRKADLVVGLWDRRVMPIECKVSNSSTNSIKRLNNDAAAKAEAWVAQFGTAQVVPVAMLSGVYKLLNLEQAQDRGLTLYWAHRLGDLTEWIERTRRA